MKKVIKIADAELEIMKIVWKSPLPVTSAEIVKKSSAIKGWKQTTIYTLLSRLVDKGYLLQQKIEPVSCYSPTISEGEFAKSQTREFVERIFGGDAKKLISMLYELRENQVIDAREIEELKNYWEAENGDE